MLLLPFLLLFLIPHSAHALALPFDPSQFSDLNSLVSPEIVKSVVKTVGFSLDHRPYEPATPLGTQVGLSLGFELTLLKLPDDLGPALNKAGPLGGNVTLVPFLPVPKLHFHKGIGQYVNLGFSFIGYRGFLLYGGDLQVTVYYPSEGPTYAVRFCYAKSKLGFAKTQTLTPQLLVSKKVAFADPYLGVGYQYTTGSINVPISLPDGSEFEIQGSQKATAFNAFLGVQWKIAVMGIALTLEGSYSSVGMHSLGTKFGMNF